VRARKRRTKYIWFPQIGTQGDSEDLDNVGFVLPLIAFPVVAGQVSDVFITDIIPDEPKETTLTADDNLADFTQNEYFLRRIVGKIQYRTQANNSGSVPQSIIVAAGFFIARAEGGGSNLPIGAATAAAARINYGPLNQQTTREPWIWRRTWLFDGQFKTSGTDGAAVIPVQTSITDTRQFGSVADGGHIDAKTARRVKSDERLFFALQGANADAVDSTQGLTTGAGWLDVRILGQMRKPQSRGVF